MSEEIDRPVGSDLSPAWLAKALRVEWLGQTVASSCWIGSVFAYGLSSSGDYLQLSAALAWLLANLAVLATPRTEKKTGKLASKPQANFGLLIAPLRCNYRAALARCLHVPKLLLTPLRRST